MKTTANVQLWSLVKRQLRLFHNQIYITFITIYWKSINSSTMVTLSHTKIPVLQTDTNQTFISAVKNKNKRKTNAFSSVLHCISVRTRHFVLGYSSGNQAGDLQLLSWRKLWWLQSVFFCICLLPEELTLVLSSCLVHTVHAVGTQTEET